MAKNFRYAIAVVGEMEGRDEAQVTAICRMGFSLSVRLMENENDIAIRVIEINNKHPGDAENLIDQLFKEI